ncbi:MAG: hypothetical protein GXY52_01370 [Chloroflexi bacterium]|nr:hypothetical protein [Chloroflexota bacterium]
MRERVAGGTRPDQITVLVSDRTQRRVYESALAQSDLQAAGGVTITTFYGLCQRAVALYWPLIAPSAGFAQPEREPVFLTVETTQHHMAQVVQPLIDESGYFSELRVRRERLYTQLIDNLNKSALVGFPPHEIAERLILAWAGSERRYGAYQQAQECALRFRAHCLRESLLDLSLTVLLFTEFVRHLNTYTAQQEQQLQHLLVDNLEENVPVALDYIAWLLPRCQSAVLASDDHAGYRVFLGAEREAAIALGQSLPRTFQLPLLPNVNPAMMALVNRARVALDLESLDVAPAEPRTAILGRISERYWAGMIKQIARSAAQIVAEGMPAGQIAVIAPYVNEVTRFSLSEELLKQGVGLQLLRPAALLRDDVVVRAALTLARLANPDWFRAGYPLLGQLPINDLAEALAVTITGLDPLRAMLLAQAAWSAKDTALIDLSSTPPPADGKSRSLWDRLGYQVRERYELLRAWLAQSAAQEPQPLDQFLSTLFGDVLSLNGFGLYLRTDLARSYGRLVESALKFRQALAPHQTGPAETSAVAAAYTAFVLGGLASAEYTSDRPEPSDNAVILAPAFAYLTRGLISRCQYWIDLRADGWWNRPNQPLTHPFVLSRNWEPGRIWYNADEDRVRHESLGRVLTGLAARCSDGVYLASSELAISGEEQTGMLERVLQVALLDTGGRT